MPLTAVLASTPYYVLMDGNSRIGPPVVRPQSGIDSFPIYGFSGADAYHAFRRNYEQHLIPYPLVKVYLRARSTAAGDDPQLIVLDAGGPREPRLQAATMEAVLSAHENKTAHVEVGYQLIFDQEAIAYRVEVEGAAV